MFLEDSCFLQSEIAEKATKFSTQFEHKTLLERKIKMTEHEIQQNHINELILLTQLNPTLRIRNLAAEMSE